MRKFDITYYCGPGIGNLTNPNITADIAASGITQAQVMMGSNVESNKQSLAMLNKYGIRAIVSDPRLQSLIYSKREDKTVVGTVDEIVREVVEDYKDVVNIDGWNIQDEPSFNDFHILAAIVKALRRYSPDKETCINLFPNYATPETGLYTPDYESYLENFVNIVDPDYLSYDHYHFLGRENRKPFNKDDNCSAEELEVRLAAEKTENRPGFFENISIVHSIAAKYNLQAMLIVLLTEHGPYRNLTYGEILWEVNMCLAYGMKRIDYFTYWLPSNNPDDPWKWDNAMCDVYGNKYQHYYDVQAINKIIRPIGEYLFDHTAEKIFHIGESNEGEPIFTSYTNIKSIDGTDGVISFFDDGSIYLVNRDYIRANTFTVHSDEPLTVFRDGYFTNLESNVITLGPGEAILLK